MDKGVGVIFAIKHHNGMHYFLKYALSDLKCEGKQGINNGTNIQFSFSADISPFCLMWCYVHKLLLFEAEYTREEK